MFNRASKHASELGQQFKNLFAQIIVLFTISIMDMR